MVKKEMQKSTLIAIIAILAVLLTVFMAFYFKGYEDSKKPGEGASFESIVQQADEHYANARYTRALREYKKAEKLQPDSYPVKIGIANSYRALGIYDEALKNYDGALKLPYADFRVHYGKGVAYYQQGDFKNAYMQLETAHELSPNDINTIGFLISSLNTLGGYDQAIGLGKAALEKNPELPHISRKLGNSYFLKNDLQNALKYEKKAAELDGSFYQNHWALGLVYLSMNDSGAAIKSFSRSSTLNPSHGASYEGLYLAYLISGDAENSKINGEKTVFFQKISSGLGMLGFAMIDNGNFNKAMEEFSKSIEAFPNYYLPYKGMGIVYMKEGNKEKAKAFLQKAWELNQYDAEVKEILDEITTDKS